MTQSLILTALATATTPMTAKELSAAIGKSESRTRELIKAEQDSILCKKNDAGANVFWIQTQGITVDTKNGPVTINPADIAIDPSKNPGGIPTDQDPLTACPFCQATDNQVQAGPEGTFLGAARTCGSCGKTYNVFSGEEVNNMPNTTEKRKPLNPQYKINAKVEAVETAGGKLKYEKDGRTWVLTMKGKEARRMTAIEFSNETPESLVAAIA